MKYEADCIDCVHYGGIHKDTKRNYCKLYQDYVDDEGYCNGFKEIEDEEDGD